jgi:hypothetical protein
MYSLPFRTIRSIGECEKECPVPSKHRMHYLLIKAFDKDFLLEALRLFYGL